MINLDFIIEGKLAAILIIPSSWGSQLAGHSPRTRKLLVPSATRQQSCHCVNAMMDIPIASIVTQSFHDVHVAI
jgi:hypothetical protein